MREPSVGYGESVISNGQAFILVLLGALFGFSVFVFCSVLISRKFAASVSPYILLVLSLISLKLSNRAERTTLAVLGFDKSKDGCEIYCEAHRVGGKALRFYKKYLFWQRVLTSFYGYLWLWMICVAARWI